MADVGLRSGGQGDRQATQSRGQLILVTALSLAILFVTLALVLNTAIYTENLATRSGDIGGATDAVRYHDAARDGVGGIIEYANANNQTDYNTLNTSVENGVEFYRNFSARQFAAGDRAVETTLDHTVPGTRIAQNDPSRNFTNTSGTEANWTVVTDVSNSRAFELNITDETALVDSGQVFRLNLTDIGGDTWRLNITHSGGDTTVGIVNGDDQHFTCTRSDEPTINLTAGTVDGDPCTGLTLAEGIDTPYTISIDNGNNIQGTFSMVVDNASLAGTVHTTAYPHLAEDGSNQPFAAHAIYSANVTVVYETSRLYYNTSVRIAPEEPDG